MNIIEVKNATVRYGDVLALDRVTFSVESGTFLGIIGPNGGGKTTLIKALLGLIEPDSGEIRIHSDRPIGYVPQFNNFERRFPISVFQVILMGGLSNCHRLFHRYSPEDRAKVEQLMDTLGLTALKNRTISQLSGGQMQKVLIARALMTDPDILILDEPTASIDGVSRTEIYSLLNRLKGEKTILIISHDTGSISSYVDAIACLNIELDYHANGHLTEESVQRVYGCPVDLVAHGIPHRVLPTHSHDEGSVSHD